VWTHPSQQHTDTAVALTPEASSEPQVSRWEPAVDTAILVRKTHKYQRIAAVALGSTANRTCCSNGALSGLKSHTCQAVRQIRVLVGLRALFAGWSEQLDPFQEPHQACPCPRKFNALHTPTRQSPSEPTNASSFSQTRISWQVVPCSVRKPITLPAATACHKCRAACAVPP